MYVRYTIGLANIGVGLLMCRSYLSGAFIVHQIGSRGIEDDLWAHGVCSVPRVLTLMWRMPTYSSRHMLLHVCPVTSGTHPRECKFGLRDAVVLIRYCACMPWTRHLPGELS
jgi:hypothetical protein